MRVLLRLIRPLDYLRIHHHEKRWYDWYLPGILSIIMLLAIHYLPVRPKILGHDGLIYYVVELLKILTGFYIASLAAIATFNKPGMDEIMPGDPPTISTTFRGRRTTSSLTRRRFLCLLFGYLAFMSMILYFGGAAAGLIAKNAKLVIPVRFFPFFKLSGLYLYLFCVSNLVITTLLGLFYMVDRIHREDPKKIEVKETD